MDVQGGHLWVGMWMVGPKDMVGHGNGAWGGTGGRCGREFDHTIHTNCTKNTQQNIKTTQKPKNKIDTAKQKKSNNNTQKKKKNGPRRGGPSATS